MRTPEHYVVDTVYDCSTVSINMASSLLWDGLPQAFGTWLKGFATTVSLQSVFQVIPNVLGGVEEGASTPNWKTMLKQKRAFPRNQ